MTHDCMWLGCRGDEIDCPFFPLAKTLTDLDQCESWCIYYTPIPDFKEETE